MATFYTGNTGRSRGPHLDFRVWDVEKGKYIDPTRFTSALSSGGKGINQFTMTDPYGKDRGSYIHKGVDYATEIGTPIDVKGTFLGTFNDPGVALQANMHIKMKMDVPMICCLCTVERALKPLWMQQELTLITLQ